MPKYAHLNSASEFHFSKQAECIISGHERLLSGIYQQQFLYSQSTMQKIDSTDYLTALGFSGMIITKLDTTDSKVLPLIKTASKLLRKFWRVKEHYFSLWQRQVDNWHPAILKNLQHFGLVLDSTDSANESLALTIKMLKSCKRLKSIDLEIHLPFSNSRLFEKFLTTLSKLPSHIYFSLTIRLCYSSLQHIHARNFSSLFKLKNVDRLSLKFSELSSASHQISTTTKNDHLLQQFIRNQATLKALQIQFEGVQDFKVLFFEDFRQTFNSLKYLTCLELIFNVSKMPLNILKALDSKSICGRLERFSLLVIASNGPVANFYSNCKNIFSKMANLQRVSMLLITPARKFCSEPLNEILEGLGESKPFLTHLNFTLASVGKYSNIDFHYLKGIASKITNFTLKLDNYCNTIFTGATLGGLFNLMKELKSLDVQFETFDSDEQVFAKGMCHSMSLKNTLSQMKKLQSLRIAFLYGDGFNTYYRNLELEEIVKEQTCDEYDLKELLIGLGTLNSLQKLELHLELGRSKCLDRILGSLGSSIIRLKCLESMTLSLRHGRNGYLGFGMYQFAKKLGQLKRLKKLTLTALDFKRDEEEEKNRTNWLLRTFLSLTAGNDGLNSIVPNTQKDSALFASFCSRKKELEIYLQASKLFMITKEEADLIRNLARRFDSYIRISELDFIRLKPLPNLLCVEGNDGFVADDEYNSDSLMMSYNETPSSND